MPAARPTVISLFSGAGGLDYGFEAAGFSTLAAVEVDPDCIATLERNRPGIALLPRSIFEVSSEDLLSEAGLDVGEADVVIGGPPCQPFSKAGYWARGDSRRLDDPRAGTLDAYFRVVEDTLPKSFLLENVEGLAYAGKNEALRWIHQRIQQINERHGTSYRPFSAVLRAAEHGVPQMRTRFFLVASREGSTFSFPEPSFGPPAEPDQLPFTSLPGYRTAWDAIGHLRPDPSEHLAPTGDWAELLVSIPEGNNYQHHTARGKGKELFGWRTRYWSFLLKLAKHLPSWTIQASPGPAIGPFHWENRMLSWREMAAIQTFPEDVVITGSRRAQQRQLGNAVPSLLAELLAREIRTQLLGLRRPRGELKLLPRDRSETRPPPSKPGPVARKYLDRVGPRAAHPGTGRGPRAAQAWAAE